MQELLEAIRSAVADGADAEQKAGGVRACRTIAAALEAQVGKPIALPGVPTTNPLAGILSPQTLDLVIAHLRNVADERDRQRNAFATAAMPSTAATAAPASAALAPTARAEAQSGVRFAFVPPQAVSRTPRPPISARPARKR